MNHMTQLAKLVDRPAEYNFPIKTIPMAGMCDIDGVSNIINCPDKQMIIRTDNNQ